MLSIVVDDASRTAFAIACCPRAFGSTSGTYLPKTPGMRLKTGSARMPGIASRSPPGTITSDTRIANASAGSTYQMAAFRTPWKTGPVPASGTIAKSSDAIGCDEMRNASIATPGTIPRRHTDMSGTR
jgi:hypothetical protein